MDRVMTYAGAQLVEDDILNGCKDAMRGIGQLARASLGDAPSVRGFATTATLPASLTLNFAAGDICKLLAADATAYSSLPADATLISKLGAYAGGAFNFPAPAGAGQSINYLVQASVTDVDTGVLVLAYYDSANPDMAYAGPGNSGTAQPTVRSTQVTLSVKAGAAAATGAQVTPAPDAGLLGLWVVTVANGQTMLADNSAVQYPGTQFLNYPLPAIDTLITNVITGAGLTPNPADLTQLLAAIRSLVSSGASTGDVKMSLYPVAPAGWVLANDGNIGNAGSGATTRANADTQPLYTVLWFNTADADAPVSGGRGASPADDFAAGKTIQLGFIAGRVLAAGGTGAGGFAGPARGFLTHLGEPTHTLTEGEIPATHQASYDNGGASITGMDGSGTGDGGNPHPNSQAHNNMQPTFFLYVFIKL